ncbi:MAG: AMP-binding protein [Gammaproteobacteria bacterium]|nr:AMP-binding protein [Gammaproteobacteria bacterium]
MPDLIAQRALLNGDAVAFRDALSGRAISYGEFDKRVQLTAGLMRQLGVETQDRVAMLCRNRVEFFELLFACAKLGAILLPLNWRMPANELLPLVGEARPAILLHGREDAAVATALGQTVEYVISLDDDGAQGYAARQQAAQPYRGRDQWPADECWYLLYTSGTTGLPKAVIQTYGMAMANYVNIRQAMSISGNDVTLNYLPLFHTAGINLVTLPTLIEGGEVIVLPGFDLEAVVGLLSNGRIDTMFAVPAVYREISLHAAFDSLDLSRVRSWGCGGAPLPDHLLSRFLERGARVCNGMGMTETGPTVFLMDPASVERKIGSVGKPQLLASVRIVDHDGQDVADGEEGELWFRGPGITPGYWRRDDASGSAFSTDGWLRSGDIGRRDADGYYYICGRIKDMFISGGENVYPAEVENQLAAHPNILEAAVVATQDDRWGEVGCAYLLPKPGHRVPPDDEIDRYCRERLAAYKVPKRYIQVDEFPRTAAGKIQKHLLSEV